MRFAPEQGCKKMKPLLPPRAEICEACEAAMTTRLTKEGERENRIAC